MTWQSNRRSLNKYGEDVFVVTVLYAGDDFREKEQEYLDKHPEYNSTYYSTGIAGHRLSPQTDNEKSKRVLSQKQYYEKHPDERNKNRNRTRTFEEQSILTKRLWETDRDSLTEKINFSRRTDSFRQKQRENLLARGNTFWKCGEDNHNSKLTWATVREIRYKYKHNSVTYKELALYYNVSESLVSKVVRNVVWNE